MCHLWNELSVCGKRLTEKKKTSDNREVKMESKQNSQKNPVQRTILGECKYFIMVNKWVFNMVTNNPKLLTKCPKMLTKNDNLNRNNSTRIDLWKESLCLWINTQTLKHWQHTRPLSRYIGVDFVLECIGHSAQSCRKQNEFLSIFPKSGK